MPSVKWRCSRLQVTRIYKVQLLYYVFHFLSSLVATIHTNEENYFIWFAITTPHYFIAASIMANTAEVGQFIHKQKKRSEHSHTSITLVQAAWPHVCSHEICTSVSSAYCELASVWVSVLQNMMYNEQATRFITLQVRTWLALTGDFPCNQHTLLYKSSYCWFTYYLYITLT